MTKYQNLANKLAQDIANGHYQAGDKLPSIRALMAAFDVSKNTVIGALHLLEAKSLVDARPKSGFIVRQQIQRPAPSSPVFTQIQPAKVAIPDLLQQVLANGAAFDIKPSDTLESENPLLSTLHRHINHSMRTQSIRKSLYYDDPQGSEPLREQLCRHYGYIGTQFTAADLCITAGCQHALLLALMASTSPGDNVVIESPGFYGVIQLLDELGLHAIEVPCNSQSGMDITILSDVLGKYSVKACVVSPAFSTPTGACMPDSAKQDLLTLAEQHDFAVIEDDIYGDLGFNHRPVPIKYFDTEQRVILCSSFSKSVSRDLRIGWIIGGRWQKKINRLKLVTHLAGNQSVQLGLATFMASGDLKRLLRRRQAALEIQRNRLIEALHRVWGNETRLSNPNGGLSLWMELPDHVDTLALYYRALALGITITPGVLFTNKANYSNFLRMSFCHPLTAGREAALTKIHSLM